MNEPHHEEFDSSVVSQPVSAGARNAPTSLQDNIISQAPKEFRKLDVTVRETDYTAGKSNLTAIVIRNTYPVPVQLISVTASHSTLSSTSRSAVYKSSTRNFSKPINTRIKLSIPNFPPSFLGKSETPFFELHRVSSVAVEPIQINADSGSVVTIDEKTYTDREVNINASSGAVINFASSPDASEEDAEKSLITPMSEVVSEYIWQTKSWLLFIPSRIGATMYLANTANLG